MIPIIDTDNHVPKNDGMMKVHYRVYWWRDENKTYGSRTYYTYDQAMTFWADCIEAKCNRLKLEMVIIGITQEWRGNPIPMQVVPDVWDDEFKQEKLDGVMGRV